jgi:fatty acid desaturase
MQNSFQWIAAMKRFEKPRLSSSLWQLTNSLLPYLGLWVLMIVMIHRGVSYPFILVVTLPASIFLVRLFIFFHDCCHGSFFASSRANRILGRHHATIGDLDRRGDGDVWTMTAGEFLAAPRYKRLAYRIYRLPKMLQWATGNIGMHHIHHLRPRIPNYNLEKCLHAVPEVRQVKPLGFFRSLRSLRLHLWDETRKRLISFRQLRHQN